MSESDEIRELAKELGKPALPFDPATVRKGQITAVDNTTATVTITLSGSDVAVPGLSYMDSYSPVVGDVVHVVQQANTGFVLGTVMTVAASGGWTNATMNTGWTAGSVGRGSTLQWRRILDNGSPKMQWRGTCTRSSGVTNEIAVGIPADSRPAVQIPILVARYPLGGRNDVVVNFNIDGSVGISGYDTPTLATTATNQAGGEHYHHIGQPDLVHNPGVHGDSFGAEPINHTHVQDAHVHGANLTAGSLTWVSFDGVEYFL